MNVEKISQEGDIRSENRNAAKRGKSSLSVDREKKV